MRYYRKKPDLQALYEEKEQQRIQRMSEIEQCGKIIRNVLEALNRALLENPSDIQHISEVAKECIEQLKRKLKDRDFQSISKFDIERMLKNRLDMIRPKKICS